jgi:hypothetical protein
MDLIASPKWSPLFKSQLVFFLALCFSSCAPLFRYVAGMSLPTKMLIEGMFFGMSLAGFAYVLLNMRNRQGPLSGREMMILASLVGVAVAVLVTRGLLLFRGS